MTCIAREEDAVVFVEVVCEALTDAVCAPPESVCKVHGVWHEDSAGGGLDVFESDLFWVRAGGELDVEAY